MDRIKSALEKAMERAKRMEGPTEEERLKWKWVPEGKRLAAEYLRGREEQISGLDKADKAQRPHILRGALEILTANIQLPKNEATQRTTERSVKAIQHLMPNNRAVKEIAGRIQYVCQQYQQFGQQQLQQAHQQLRSQFEVQVQEAIRRQTGSLQQAQVNVESLPEFQQEWIRVRNQVEQQYDQHLEEYRQQLQSLI